MLKGEAEGGGGGGGWQGWDYACSYLTLGGEKSDYTGKYAQGQTTELVECVTAATSEMGPEQCVTDMTLQWGPATERVGGITGRPMVVCSTDACDV